MAEPLGIGLVGHAFIGAAHVNAYRQAAAHFGPLPREPRMARLVGQDEQRTAAAARQLGFAAWGTDWCALLEDDSVGLVDVCGPNDTHAEIAAAAARSGRHVLCEKPLGRDADEALAAWRAVRNAGVVHLCGFNYRFLPALQLARRLVVDGRLGSLRHVQARYLQDWNADPQAPWTWRMNAARAGSGALGDLGAHLVDLVRFLAGEPEAATGALRTFVDERDGHPVDVDDAFAATLDLPGEVLATLEGSRTALGRKNALELAVYGTRGALRFDLERLNELHVLLEDDEPQLEGFRRVMVTEAEHPYVSHWWPPGHVLGWEHALVHEVAYLVGCVGSAEDVRPLGADFEDGYRAAEVCGAIARAARSGTREPIVYREVTT